MTTIDHLNPPTGHMADNVVGFARALRAAGIPVGPGTVIDALNALQVIEIGNRAAQTDVALERFLEAFPVLHYFLASFRRIPKIGGTDVIFCFE